MSRSSSALLAVVLVAGLVVAGARWLRPTVEAPERTDPAIAHRIDLNRADADEIAALPGIGDVLAARIVEYRGLRGSFSRVEDLERVDGIGPLTVERIREHIRCEVEEP